jgi:hypothetical protein
MSGISTHPLGYDDSGRSYWQFPNISTLFIAPKASLRHREPDREALLRKLQNLSKDKTSASSHSSPVEKPSDDSSVDEDWYVLSDVALITKLMESLGTSKSEQSLKKALSFRYNNQHHAVTKPTMRSTTKIEDHMSCEEENGVKKGTKLSEDEMTPSITLEESTSGGTSKAATTPRRDKLERESVRRKGEGKPMLLSLVTEKGVEMQSTYVLKEENVFGNRENDATPNGEYLHSDSGDDEESYLDYFTFSKTSKYYAIALLDREQKIIKPEKNKQDQRAVTVVFQIQKEGVGHTLAYTPLSEPWSDGIYYFSTLTFKRSGRYTISFLVEGFQWSHIQPLVYVVNVTAENIISGPSSALSRLRAQEYLNHLDRHITRKRKELLQFLSLTEQQQQQRRKKSDDDEFAAVKSCLVMVYLALPFGSLVMGDENEEEEENVEEEGRGEGADRHDLMAHVIDATGWNTQLDSLWRKCVLESSSSTILMECTLVLEYYISKNWFMSPANRLISSLPSPHFAIRCVTNSSVALRIFCLDKCLAYERVQTLKGSKTHATTTTTAAALASSRRNKLNKTDVADEVLAAYTARPKRAAMAKAREALSESVKYQLDEGSDEEGGGRRNLRARAPRPSWTCPECGTRNDDRNRSCVECGGRKRNTSHAPVTTTHLSRAERLGRRRRAMYGAGSDESSAESSDSSNDDEGDRNHVVTQSLRKRSRVSYREEEEGEEDEEDEEERGRGGTGNGHASTGSRSRKRTTRSRSDDGDEEEDEEVVEDDEILEYIPPQPVDIDELLQTRRAEIGELGLEEDIPCALLTMLKKIQQDPESLPFWEPVDTTLYTDYRFAPSLPYGEPPLTKSDRDKVSEPMDMNAIIRRVEVGFYGNEYDDFAKVNTTSPLPLLLLLT